MPLITSYSKAKFANVQVPDRSMSDIGHKTTLKLGGGDICLKYYVNDCATGLTLKLYIDPCVDLKMSSSGGQLDTDRHSLI